LGQALTLDVTAFQKMEAAGIELAACARIVFGVVVSSTKPKTILGMGSQV
jgi:hypothetical protein